MRGRPIPAAVRRAWATLIVRELLHGPRRFGELREALPGISAHTLTNRLRLFESRGIVIRRAYAEVPPRVVYELTDLGRSCSRFLTPCARGARKPRSRPSCLRSLRPPGVDERRPHVRLRRAAL